MTSPYLNRTIRTEQEARATVVIRLHPIVPEPHPPADPSMFATRPARVSLALVGCLAFLIGANLTGAWLQHRAEARVVTRLMLRDGLQPLPPSPEEFAASFDARTE